MGSLHTQNSVTHRLYSLGEHMNNAGYISHPEVEYSIPVGIIGWIRQGFKLDKRGVGLGWIPKGV